MTDDEPVDAEAKDDPMTDDEAMISMLDVPLLDEDATITAPDEYIPRGALVYRRSRFE